MQTAKTRADTCDAAIFGRLFTNGTGVLPSSVARYVLGLAFSEEDHARMHELTLRNKEGALSTEEWEELLSYIRVGHLLAILQSKARRALKKK